MTDLLNSYHAAAQYIKEKIDGQVPYVGIILGSGLGSLADKIQNPTVIPYREIPGFPESTAIGHKGNLIFGDLAGKKVIAMQGRFHYYEGYGMDQVVFPIQTMHMLGIEKLILTNAAGCINKAWKPGTLMIISDHIKLTSECPMRGHNEDELGLRFFDMSRAYDPDLRTLARTKATELGVNFTEGVYMFFAGPNFETPAEIRAARILGADAAGMSTVPEAIAAAHCGMKTLGISCMTNMAAGILDQPLGHGEVLETGLRVKNQFSALIRAIVKDI